MRRLLVLGVVTLMAQPVVGQDWDCYAPQPGHPTQEERKAFIEDVSGPAVDAETKYGVPAPAIVAMAIHESGYGFTRTALYANNLFGFKWTSAASAGNRRSWELECQPAWDEGKLYIKFKSRKDAIDFVASRLATSSHYRADTNAFKAAMARGDDRQRAIAAWVDGIADPYNYDPERYARRIKQILNNAMRPSETLSATDNLYGLGFTAPPAPPVAEITDEPTLRVRDLFKSAIAAGGRYMEQNCRPVGESDALFSGILAPYRVLSTKAVVVNDCRYPFTGNATARVLMANVDADQLARWISSACNANQVDDVERCRATSAHSIWCGSNAQFAISGVVREPAEVCGGPAGKESLITFRDGVTVETEGVPYCATQPLTDEQAQASISGKIVKTKKIGRIAMVTRDMYKNGGGTVDVSSVSPGASGDVPWLQVVRDGYLESIGRDSYPLLDAWVKANKASFGKYAKLGLASFDCGAYFGAK